MVKENDRTFSQGEQSFQELPDAIIVPKSVARCSSSNSDDGESQDDSLQLPSDFCISLQNMAMRRDGCLDNSGSSTEPTRSSLFQTRNSQVRLIVDELDVQSSRDTAPTLQKTDSCLSRTSQSTGTLEERSYSRHSFTSVSRSLPVSRLSTMEDLGEGEEEDIGRNIRPEGFHRFRRIPSCQVSNGKFIRRISTRLETNVSFSEDEAEADLSSRSCDF